MCEKKSTSTSHAGIIYNPFGHLQEAIKENVLLAVGETTGGDIGWDATVETPPQEMGDLAVPVFSLSRFLKKSPRDIAEEIAEKTAIKMREKGLLGEVISEIKPVGGYINFRVKGDWLAYVTLRAISVLGERYGTAGRTKDGGGGQRVVLEHTSANPTDDLHVGRARNPIIGDTLARVLRHYGNLVETQYYVDDMGKQAVLLAYGEYLWEKLGDEEKKGHLGPYQYAVSVLEKDPGAREEVEKWVRAIEHGTPLVVGGKDVAERVGESCKRVLEEKILETLKTANIKVDSLVYESSFVKDGSVKKVIERLQKLPQAQQDATGAWYIDMAPFGVRGRDTKFYFTRSDGTSLYATRDIAYHIWKLERYDRAINVLGEDHRLEAKQVAVALQLLGYKKLPEVVFYAFVGLPGGRMSTRRGQVVYFRDLLEEAVERALAEVKRRRTDLDINKQVEIARAVGIGAVRYNIIRVQPEKKMVFRWEDALNFEGESAPFIQYSHARACSIMRKAKEDGAVGDVIDEDMHTYAGLLSHPSERRLIKDLAYFPSAISRVAHEKRPHHLADITYAVAKDFNQFYRDCPVLSSPEKNLREARLLLVLSTKTVLATGLRLLGIEAPEEM